MTHPYPPVSPPPGYGYGADPYASPASPVRRAANPLGIVATLVGGGLVLLGSFLPWYTDTYLGDIVNALDADGAKAFPKAYFDWLMWVLLAVTVVAGLFANLPLGAATALRIVSPILGALGAVLVFASLNDLISNGSAFDHSAVGLYLTLVGFLLAGVGGVLGPRRAVT